MKPGGQQEIYIRIKDCDWLSGWWFGICCIFPFHIWDVILPIDELIFFRGAGIPTTRWCLIMYHPGGPANVLGGYVLRRPCEGHVPWGVSLLAQCARRGEWIQLLHWSSPKFERICQVHHNESPDNDVYFAMKESRIVSHRMWTSLRIQSETRATMVPTFGRQLYRHMTWAGTSTLNITSSSGCLLFHFIYVVLKRD